MGKQKAAPPMRFEPSDFSTDKYRCVNVINLRDRCPVIIMASESCDPPYYRVVDGLIKCQDPMYKKYYIKMYN